MDLAGLFEFLREQPLLVLAMAAIFVTVMGGMVKHSAPGLSKILQGTGNLALVGALLLTIGQVARFTTGSDLALSQVGMPVQEVVGGETRVEISPDGHFWVTASINGVERRFLIDTGATLTAISPTTATAASVPEKAIRQTINMRTANGEVRAELATIGELRFGNIVARDLDSVIAPGLGETNVIGMNLMSRLASWRVEGRTLILVPNNSQQIPET